MREEREGGGERGKGREEKVRGGKVKDARKVKERVG